MTIVLAGEPPAASVRPTLAAQRARLATRMLLPAQVLLVGIVAFPLLMQVYVSLTWWSPLDGEPWYRAYKSWNGLGNYGDLIGDAALLQAIGRTLMFVAISVPIEFFAGLLLACLFYEGVLFRSFLYSIVLMPMMIVPAVAGYIFFLIFQQSGPLNAAMAGLVPGAADLNWLSDVNRAFAAVVIADVWQWTPLMFLILYAGLLGLPEDQMRAASILGAGWWQRFRRIALPRLRGVIVIALALRTVECLKIFDMLFVMTGGGPGVATQSLSLYLYKHTFQDLDWSYVAAIGIAVLVVLSVVTGVAMERARPSATARS